MMSHFIIICRNIQYGDIVNWNSANWNVSGMEEYDTEYTNICEPKTVGLILMPGAWTVHESINICKVLRGEINVISDQTNQEKLMQLMNATNTCMPVGEYHKKIPLML